MFKKETSLGQVGNSGLYHLGNGVYGGKGAWKMFNEAIKKDSLYGKG